MTLNPLSLSLALSHSRLFLFLFLFFCLSLSRSLALSLSRSLALSHKTRCETNGGSHGLFWLARGKRRVSLHLGPAAVGAANAQVCG